MGNGSPGLEAAFIALPVLMLVLLLAGLWRIRGGRPDEVAGAVSGGAGGRRGASAPVENDEAEPVMGGASAGLAKGGRGESASRGPTAPAIARTPLTASAPLTAGTRKPARAPSTASEAKLDGGGGSAVLLAAVLAPLWLVLTALAAGVGLLTFASTPPTLLIAVVIGVLLAIRLGTSRVGLRLAGTVPLALLVGTQAFRLPLELAMHRAWVEGLMPQQMSYSGLNFDIVTGATALLLGVALAYWRVPAPVVHAWNAMGFLLLLNIVTIAVLSAPIPLRVFMNEPANTWITAFPWVWLPTVLVPAAFLGHVLVWRRLRMERGSTPAAAPVRA